MSYFSRAVGCVLTSLSVVAVLAAPAVAQNTTVIDRSVVTGKMEWGIWVDDDGCMHWWADGGVEGYMVPRRNPKTGKPVCMRRNTCLVESADALFASGSHQLTDAGRTRLRNFFAQTKSYAFAIYGHTDSAASDDFNLKLSERRAATVGDLARSVGATVQRQVGLGESKPIASNATAEGMARNRRVEIVCYN